MTCTLCLNTVSQNTQRYHEYWWQIYHLIVTHSKIHLIFMSNHCCWIFYGLCRLFNFCCVDTWHSQTLLLLTACIHYIGCYPSFKTHSLVWNTLSQQVSSFLKQSLSCIRWVVVWSIDSLCAGWVEDELWGWSEAGRSEPPLPDSCERP